MRRMLLLLLPLCAVANEAPQINFYDYANGTWQKQNPIPKDQARWNQFSVLEERTLDKLHQLVKSTAKNTSTPKHSIEQKIGDFYFSGMDVQSINAQGLKPIQPELNQIAAIHDLKSLQETIAHLHEYGFNVAFNFSSMQDFKNSQYNMPTLIQAGLSLPDRDDYLNHDEKSKNLRQALQKTMINLFVLDGVKPNQALKNAKAVLDLETRLAKASMSKITMRDPNAIYNPSNLTHLQQKTPHWLWHTYFKAIKAPKMSRINIATPNYFIALDDAFTSIPIATWRHYLQWHVLMELSPYLSEPFVQEQFKFTRQLSGVESIKPRWRRVIDTENQALGFAIGQVYVEHFFSKKTRHEVSNIINNIKITLQQDLKTLSWMSPKTKEAALEKLAHMQARIGYPKKWWNYETLEINRGPYVLNVLAAEKFLVQRDWHKINKPVDKDEWAMTPQTINAYYDPSMNNINLTAAILQPPFFDEHASKAVNYGGIGFVIGHEITHGFDDMGAKFDAYGNLKNWWTPEDLKNFQAATQCIVKQYSNYTVNDTLHLKGQLVAGEATADLGGLTLAYRAFNALDTKHREPTIEGLTPNQQFFLSAAHIWASNIRPTFARILVNIDPHPPANYRVNGTLANMQDFQKSFAIPNNAPMVHTPRCEIW